MTQPAISPDNITHAERFVRERLAGEGTGHDWWHIERVRNVARLIQQSEGGDAALIDMTLLLHDIGDRKVIGKEDDDYTIAQDFLRSQQIDDHTITAIIDIIKGMSFSKTFDQAKGAARSLEFQIVQDADRLDALGAIGIARAFTYGGSCLRPMYDPEAEIQEFNSTDAFKKHLGDTLHHFDEKLFLLKDKLNTGAARTIAAERDRYMHDFYDRFLDEWHGRA